MRSDRRSSCPISVALDLLGDRWTLLVVRDLLLFGKSTYGEFLASGEGIATNILAERLKRIEAAGLVVRQKTGRTTRYAPTAKGIDLVPTLLELIAWSGRHEETAAPRAFLERLATERRAVEREIRARLGAKPPRAPGGTRSPRQ
jgi:DNA-binding HxlR family transcriptional regulator